MTKTLSKRNSAFTDTFLKKYGITPSENEFSSGFNIGHHFPNSSNHNFGKTKTFEPIWINVTPNEYRKFSKKQKEYSGLKFDNLIINYCDVWGQKIFEGEWKKPYSRIRRNDKNLTYYLNSEGKKEQLRKYHSAKGSSNHIFLNGLYTYFFKPLLEKHDNNKEAVLNEIISGKLLERVVLTEGEKKAFYACKKGIPTIGVTGIHNFGTSVKNDEGFTINVHLLGELQHFLFDFNVKGLTLLHDSDCFDNVGKKDRALSFAASPRNLKFGIDNYNELIERKVRLSFCWIAPIFEDGKEKFGLDDLLLKYPNQSDLIKEELLSIPKNVRQFIKKVKIPTFDGTPSKDGTEKVRDKNLGIDVISKIRSLFKKSIVDTSSYLPTHNPNVYGKFQKYIGKSDLKKKLIIDILEVRKSVLVIPPNSGKSYFSYNGLERSIYGKYGKENVYLINVAPLEKLTKQQQKDCTDLGKPEVRHLYSEGAKGASVDIEESSRFNSTLKQLPHLLERLENAGKFDTHKVIIIFDEFSEKVRADYQNNFMLQYWFDKCSHIIGLTATCLTVPTVRDGFKIFQLEKEDHPLLNVTIHYSKRSQQPELVEKWIKSNGQKRNLYFHQSVKDTEIYNEVCLQNNLKSNFYHAKLAKDKKRENEAVNELIDNRRMEDGQQLHTTKALELGINCDNVDNVVFIQKTARFDLINLYQSFYRDRGKEINLHIFLTEQNKVDFRGAMFDFDSNLFNERKEELGVIADAFNQSLNIQQSIGSTTAPNEIANSFHFPEDRECKKFIKFNEIEQRFFIWSDAIWSNQLKQINRSYETKDFISWVRNLPNSKVDIIPYNSDLIEEVTHFEAIQEKNKEVEKDFDSFLETDIFQNVNNFNCFQKFIFEQTEDNSLKGFIDSHFHKIDDFSNPNFSTDLTIDTNEFLKRTFLSSDNTLEEIFTSKFKIASEYLKRYYEVLALSNNTLDKARIISIIFQKGIDYRISISQLQAFYRKLILEVTEANEVTANEIKRTDKRLFGVILKAKHEKELTETIEISLDGDGDIITSQPKRIISNHKFKNKSTGYKKLSVQGFNRNVVQSLFSLSKGKRSKYAKMIRLKRFELSEKYTEKYKDEFFNYVEKISKNEVPEILNFCPF